MTENSGARDSNAEILRSVRHLMSLISPSERRGIAASGSVPCPSQEISPAGNRGQEARMRGQEARMRGKEARMRGKEARMRGKEARMRGKEARMRGQEARIRGQEARMRGQAISHQDLHFKWK
ncbi:hypothetical protein CgunFtcFv8_016385 [Champsocephalus gunnari]|uniref:Uncharacterized protein n=1 Tax=Champsocephalus gunnari TaxID=52237 RepID=A0AAN8CTN1_CHAGU|nr:hypothetical protein CgunFtcFv8_016385 [Champsocephalus gunnari]